MPIHTYIDAETGETTAVEMTGDELKEYLDNTAKAQAELSHAELIQQQKEALLAKLNITNEEAKLLLS